MTPGPLCLKWWLRASVQEVCKVRTTFKIWGKKCYICNMFFKTINILTRNLSIHETNAWDLQCIVLVHINCHSRCETLLELQLLIEKWDKNLPLFLNKETNGIFFALDNNIQNKVVLFQKYSQFSYWKRILRSSNNISYDQINFNERYVPQTIFWGYCLIDILMSLLSKLKQLNI